MDGKSGDEGDDELIWVRWDESDRDWRSTGWRSSLGSSFQRMLVCKFLLVNNTNLQPIFHRFQVIADYRSNVLLSTGRFKMLHIYKCTGNEWPANRRAPLVVYTHRREGRNSRTLPEGGSWSFCFGVAAILATNSSVISKRMRGIDIALGILIWYYAILFVRLSQRWRQRTSCTPTRKATVADHLRNSAAAARTGPGIPV